MNGTLDIDRELGKGESTQAAAPEGSSSKPPMSFQERIALERRRKEPEPSLPQFCKSTDACP
jgi:hypothetical protein